MGKFIISESEKDQIRKMYGLVNEQSVKTVEEDQEFMNWLETVVISAFVAPNPYNGGELKIGVKISPYVEEKSSYYEMAKNIIEQVNVVTIDGKSVYQDIGGEKIAQGGNRSFGMKEVIGGDIVYYDVYGDNSELLNNIKQTSNSGKTNKFIVTVTPRLLSNLKIDRSNFFKTKPATLIVTI